MSHSSTEKINGISVQESDSFSSIDVVENQTPLSTSVPDHDPNELEPNGNVAQLLENKQEPKAHYEHLIQTTKQKMADKFDQLEKETNIILTNRNDGTYSKELKSNELGEESNHDGRLKDLKLIGIEKENKRLKDELNLKNDLLNKMLNIRTQVEAELEDLTVSLFEEANKMVYEANVQRDRTEKALFEANLKIDMVTAEVQALKMLVITSTPSKPNLQSNHSNKSKHSKENTFEKPKKSPSNYELGSATSQVSSTSNDQPHRSELLDIHEESDEHGEIDPEFYEEFLNWKKSPTLDPISSSFMRRIYDEEIYPVFNFKNKDLTSMVLRSVENNTLTIESVHNDKFGKKCALLGVAKLCHHRMKIGDDQWYAISQLSRNRIIAVCELFCYLRYIKNGLVKGSPREVYWKIMVKRKNVAISKLGFVSCAN